MRELSKRLGVEVITIDQMGLNGDAIEAEAFGYLAVRNVKGLPISFPETTGVPHPMTGGKFHQVPRHG
jgi:anhydro-N-acetylmuramic acid kinase